MAGSRPRFRADPVACPDAASAAQLGLLGWIQVVGAGMGPDQAQDLGRVVGYVEEVQVSASIVPAGSWTRRIQSISPLQ